MDTEEKHVLYKSLVSRRENYYNLTIKATQLKAKNVKRHLTKEYIQMATKHTKMLDIISHKGNANLNHCDNTSQAL